VEGLDMLAMDAHCRVEISDDQRVSCCARLGVRRRVDSDRLMTAVRWGVEVCDGVVMVMMVCVAVKLEQDARSSEK
jgi:hypothetical protein